MEQTKGFNMETAGVKGFCAFLRNNVLLVIAVSAALFFTYGIKLFWYNVGVDTELFMADKFSTLRWHIQSGRFGLSLLTRFWYIKEFNPFTAFFTAFCLIWIFTLSWCYIIAVFDKNTGRNDKLIPFALLFMTMPVWGEMFYFTMMAAETAFAICLCPYVIYLLYKGFLDNEKGKIAAACLLLVFLTSVYQAIIPLFCCGVFACFMLLQEHSDYEPKMYRLLCLKLFVALMGSLAVYFFIDRIIIPFIFHIEKNEYLENMNQWGKIPVRENIKNILQFIIDGIPLWRKGNIWLLLVSFLFLFETVKVIRGKIPGGRRFLYILAGIGVPFCIMALTIAGGARPPARSLWALPFGLAFMCYFLIKTWKTKAAALMYCLAMLAAVYQAEITAQLFYSDQLRYNEDVRLAYDLDKMIRPLQNETNSLPVALVGRYRLSSMFEKNFLRGEVPGNSIFGFAESPGDPEARRGLTFMKSLGIHFEKADMRQLEQARREAQNMPVYPNPGCVRRLPDLIVVRLAESVVYPYERKNRN
jgi:hypothetical protein